MSRLDAVIFGATGFTGKYTVIHMIEFVNKYNIGAWGVAGRSEKKLNAVMEEVAKKTGADLSGVKIIIADVGDEKSLEDMCAQTKVVINCCGPYHFYGEPVVKAAIEKKAHYVDVSGEPNFMELMQLRYNDLAREAGVYVVSACGWDSIPADMGVVFLQKNFQGVVNAVRSYVTTSVPPEAMAKAEGRGLINYGTWESMINGITRKSELGSLRKQLFPEPLPRFEPKLNRQIIHKKDGKGAYYLPFLGSDESVVYRSQRYFYEQENERPIQFRAYVKSGNIFTTVLGIFAALSLFIMTKISFTRQLLLDYPKLFSLGYISKEGPTEEVMNNTSFKFQLIGEGWEEGSDVNTKPNKRVVAEISGTNPGYGATCVALLSAALALLQDTDKLPATGGVLTTAPVFKNTNIIKNLNENGIKFEIIDTQKI